MLPLHLPYPAPPIKRESGNLYTVVHKICGQSAALDHPLKTLIGRGGVRGLDHTTRDKEALG